MREILSRAVNPKAPLHDQEFCELRLYRSNSEEKLVYDVRESSACWLDELLIGWNTQLLMFLETLPDAKTQYAARRRILMQQGFIWPDMDRQLNLE